MKKNIIYGMHPVMEAIRTHQNIDKIFIQQKLRSESFAELKKLMDEKKLGYKTVPVEKLNRLTKENHQGVVAFISPVKIYSVEELLEKSSTTPYQTYILLDGITDPRNLGSIIRTAVAADVNGIIIPENNSAPLNDEVVKSSAGGIFKIDIARAKHLLDAIFLLKSYDIKIISASEKAEKTVYETNLKQNMGIILGNEGKGVQKNILKNSDLIVKLPMSDKMQSLNVSVASGIILYEGIRQRFYNK